MDKTTKKFILFLSIAFVIVTAIIMFGGYSYQLNGVNPVVGSKSSGGAVNGNLSAYSDAMHEKISSKWSPPAVDKDSRVVLEFTIQKNGHVINPKIYKSSGNKQLDDSAMKALRSASPLPPLPLNFEQNSLNVKFDFAVKGKE